MPGTTNDKSAAVDHSSLSLELSPVLQSHSLRPGHLRRALGGHPSDSVNGSVTDCIETMSERAEHLGHCRAHVSDFVSDPGLGVR